MPVWLSRIWGIVFILLYLLSAGCDTQGNSTNGHYLLRIGGMVVTGMDYLEALEVMKAAYPYDALQDKQVEKTIKTRLLKQLTEELILSKRARELGLSVSDDEVKQGVKAVKEGYSEGNFEKMLLEKAIPLGAWQKRVKMRLLTEKVIDRELVAMVKLTPDEVNQFYRDCYPEKLPGSIPPHTIDTAFVKQLRREKAQKQYPQWIDTLQKQYDIELNEQQWKIICD